MADSDIRNILVMDDNVFLAHAIGRHLRREGFHVVVAYNSRMAKELVVIAESVVAPFDLVIADIQISTKLGNSFVAWLNLNFPRLVVVFVSSFVGEECVNEVVRPHLDLWHRKPVLPGQIMASIRKINRYRRETASVSG